MKILSIPLELLFCDFYILLFYFKRCEEGNVKIGSDEIEKQTCIKRALLV